jgi:hypothetical protein
VGCRCCPWAAEHQLVSAAAVQTPGHRGGDRLGRRQRPDAGVGLAPVLVAGPEPAGVVAHVHDLDPPGGQVDASCPQAEQLPAAQARADLDDEVVAGTERAAANRVPTGSALKL